MTIPLPRFVAILTIAATALLASACSSPAPEPEPSASSTPDAAATDPAAEPEPTATAEPGEADEPTCETIISAATVADFESLGWSSLADPFVVGGVELPGGIQCIWGDFSTATDHVQIFGWAPITPEQAQTAQDELVAQGWTLEQGPEGVYVTESAETASATDEEGYGLTYLFGDGWVKYADTKLGLVLVEWEG